VYTFFWRTLYILNKWMNDGKEKAKFKPVARLGSWTDIFKYLYRTIVKIKCLTKNFRGQ